MQKSFSIGPVCFVLYLVACGGDDPSAPVVPEFAGAPPHQEAPEPPPAAMDSADVDEANTASSGGVREGMDLDPVLTPTPPTEPPPSAEPAPMETPEPAPMEPVDPIAEAGGVPRPAGNLSTGFFVSDGRLYDRLGADFVMRGINHPVAWFQGNALEWMDEIATTGANSVRIVWETTAGSPQVLAASIERAIELSIVPIVELHDETGSNDIDGPARLAQYYVGDLTEVLETYEPYLLVNIANEWGDYFSTADSWVDAYRRAIGVFRGAGLNHTLVIDANDYGQRGQTIVQNGRQLLDIDPQHNVLFSTHMYQAYEDPQMIVDVMRGARDARLAMIVGEFGFQHGDRDGQPIPVPFEVMLQEAASSQIGYLAWSWTGNSDYVGYLDLSVNGSASQLTEWGDAIINGENGIRSTSQPASTFAAP